MPLALTSVYPNLEERTRSYFDKLAIQHNIKTIDDWFSIHSEDFPFVDRKDALLRGNEQCVHSSPLIALSIAYPQQIKGTPYQKGYWKDTKNHRILFDQIAKELNVQTFEDWYQVTIQELQLHGAKTLMSRCYSNSLLKGRNRFVLLP